MRTSDTKKILFILLVIGSFIIARRYSGVDALLETGFLIAGADVIWVYLSYRFCGGHCFYDNSMGCTPTGEMHMDGNWTDDNQCGLFENQK